MFRARLAPLMCVLLAAAGPVAATVTSINTNSDTFIRSGNQNEGAETFLRVRSSGSNRALVRFDQSAISSAVTGGTVLVSATLELYIEFNNDNWGTGREVDVHRLQQDWTELGVTSNCPIDTDTSNGSPDCAVQWGGGDFDPTPTDTLLQTDGVTGVVSFDVTADVLAFLGGTDNFGWIVKKRNENQNGVLEYSSREGTPGQQAKLVIEVLPPTPTPTSTPTDTPTATPSNTPTITPTPLPECGAQPIQGCRQSLLENKSLLIIKDKGGLKDKLLFKWIKGQATDKSAFGDPVTVTTYTFCLYDENGGAASLVSQAILPPAGICGSRPCWKERSKGYIYKDSLLQNDGIKLLKLTSGVDGKSKVTMKGQGSGLNLPALPLNQDQTVIAQLKNGEGECFEARFSGPPKRSTDEQFKDKADPPITFPPTATVPPTFTPTATPAGSAATFTPTATVTATPTAGGPTFTATNTASPTPTETPLPPLGTQVCTLKTSTSRLFLQLAAAGVLIRPDGMIEIDCGATDPVTGQSMCTCDLLQFTPINLLGIGDVCIDPAGPCPAAPYDCDGGAPLDLDLYADHDIGPQCTSNAGCATQCDAFCAGLPGGAAYERQASSCEGFCIGGTNDDLSCTEDADCPGGQCPGQEPAQGGAHTGDCNCSCQAKGIGAASTAGTLTCNLGLAISVERDQDLICGNSVPSITLAPLCGSLSTGATQGVIEHANSQTGSNNDIGPLDTVGQGQSCTNFTAGNLTNMQLTGYLAFYDSSLGDILAEQEFICQ